MKKEFNIDYDFYGVKRNFKTGVFFEFVHKCNELEEHSEGITDITVTITDETPTPEFKPFLAPWMTSTLKP